MNKMFILLQQELVKKKATRKKTAGLPRVCSSYKFIIINIHLPFTINTEIKSYNKTQILAKWLNTFSMAELQ